ncbi:uncharacterized protein RJT21DRAFT_122605 [Scheffersomyces amazonensis]|uniref:uncharacterized protein n=1 Tax=Scheffersomyces amazonensis TaxID=1078765 RepID=UPI00315D06FB
MTSSISVQTVPLVVNTVVVVYSVPLTPGMLGIMSHNAQLYGTVALGTGPVYVTALSGAITPSKTASQSVVILKLALL